MSAASDEFDADKASIGMDKYSRQIGAYGIDVMKFLRRLRVLIVGMKGVGIETAKNLVLSGIKAVDIADSGAVALADLNTNLFLTADCVGKGRAASVEAGLQELNEDVEVKAVTEAVTEEVLTRYQAVVVTDNSVPLATLEAWNVACAAAKVLFVVATSSGMAAFVFADFGDEHTVTDRDGKEPRYVAIKSIDVAADGKLDVELVEPHQLDDGDWVRFENVSGIGLEDNRPLPIIRRYRSTSDSQRLLVSDRFAIETGDADVCSWGKDIAGGFVRQVKQPIDVEHRRLGDALLWAGVAHAHVTRSIKGAAQVLIAQRALWQFVAERGRLPALHCNAEAEAVVAMAKAVNAGAQAGNARNCVDELDEDYARKMALYARTECIGMCAFVGGVAAQEVMKKCGKWTPVGQFLVHDELGMLDAQVRADATPVGSRYDHHIAMFGSAFQQSLMNERWLVVGCGALGCEYIKSLALMGVGCAVDGQLLVADHDTVELSNLARHVLFRRRNLGQPKSVCAGAAARAINHQLNVGVYEHKLAPDTHSIFDRRFWTSLRGVCTAVDNRTARLHVDAQTTLWKIPLLACHTLNTEASSDVFVPFKTNNYAHQQGVHNEAGSLDKVTSFHYTIEQTIRWAGKTGQFQTLFVTPADDLRAAIDDLDKFEAMLVRCQSSAEQIERLEPLVKLLKIADSLSFDACVDLAFEHMIEQYRNAINDLIYHYPADSTTTWFDRLVPFWSAPKRFPTAINWNSSEPERLHVDYLYNCANLYARMFRLDHNDDGRANFNAYLVGRNLQPAAWAAPDCNTQVDFDGRLAELKTRLQSYNWAPLRERADCNGEGQFIVAAEFDVDDDSNFHVDFVVSASNLRAFNFSIPFADRHQTKMIAGNIVPAVAATTATIVGLNSIELLKLKLGVPICSANINLGTSTFSLFEPEAARGAVKEYDPIEMCDTQPVPDGFTVWDSVTINSGDLTLQQLIDCFPQRHHGCTPIFVAAHGTPVNGDSVMFTDCRSAESQQQKLARKVSELYADSFGSLPTENYILLTVACTKDDSPVKIPNPVVFQFRD